MRPPRRATIALTASVAVLATGAGVYAAAPSAFPGWPYDDLGSRPNAAANAAAAPDPVLAVVGDTACEADDPATNADVDPTYKCGGAKAPGGLTAAYATVDRIEAMKPDALALLGDEQYQVGRLSDFENSFDKTYGALKWLIKPAPGNHEYYSYKDGEAGQDGAGYFGYFNGTDADGNPRPAGQAGDDTASAQGWYSYNIGDWHVISLNAECGSKAFGGNGSKATAAGCDPTQGLAKAETDWLSADLAADRSRCTVAYWHQPTFSAADDLSQEGSVLGQAWWKLLYRHGHAIVLNGHEHLYARFAPQDPTGAVDEKRGIRQFIVGVGGEALDDLAPATDLAAAHVVTGEDQAYGAMKLTLGQHGHYSWDFEPSYAPSGAPADAMSYSDKGSATC